MSEIFISHSSFCNYQECFVGMLRCVDETYKYMTPVFLQSSHTPCRRPWQPEEVTSAATKTWPLTNIPAENTATSVLMECSVRLWAPLSTVWKSPSEVMRPGFLCLEAACFKVLCLEKQRKAKEKFRKLIPHPSTLLHNTTSVHKCFSVPEGFKRNVLDPRDNHQRPNHLLRSLHMMRIHFFCLHVLGCWRVTDPSFSDIMLAVAWCDQTNDSCLSLALASPLGAQMVVIYLHHPNTHPPTH